MGPERLPWATCGSLRESTTVEGYARVEGLMRRPDQSNSSTEKRTNVVQWTLCGNDTKQIKSGVPSFVQTAVLLKRDRKYCEPLAHFSADIVVRGEVDNDEWVRDKGKKATKRMSGKRRGGESVIFNPKRSRGSVKDVSNLASVDLESYKQLITIRQWVDGTGDTSEQEEVLASRR